MAKTKSGATVQQPVPPSAGAAERLVAWIQARKTALTVALVAVVLIGGSAWFLQAAKVRRENFAANALDQARVSVDAGNLELAAADLGRIVSEYGGTTAGQDARILLARVHLLQGNAELAVSELRTFLASGDTGPFRAAANSLLANALEQLGRYDESADAFLAAADASEYDLIRAEFLMEAGRVAALAGDTARAAAAYERIIAENPGTASETEARLRLGEVLKGAIPKQPA